MISLLRYLRKKQIQESVLSLQLTSEMKSTIVTSNFMEKRLNQTKQDVRS